MSVPEITAKYNACKSDQDCTIITVADNCDPTCGVAVNRESLDAWSSERAELSGAYCRAPARWPEHCGVHTPNCTETVALCDRVGGRCYAAEAANPCTERPLDECEDDTCTVARGSIYDARKQCFSPQSEAIGCVRRAFECPEEQTPVVDADGNCYVLADQCVPDNFQQASADRDCRLALGKTCSN
jgi:hypothetical protein